MRISTKHTLLLFGVLAFITIVLLKGDSNLWKAVALGGLIVFLWLVEALPIYVTAMLPLALAVPMGLLTTDQIAGAYANKFVFLFLGGFLLALAMEKWDVHKQIAHSIISVVGKSKARIILGFIISTGLLSMWISNTATTLMMLPMAMAVVSNLKSDSKSKFPLFLLLAIAYSASIGGMATLVGSPPNSVMAGVLSDNYGIEITFLDWMKYGLPLAMILLTMLFLFFVIRLRGEHKGDDIKIDLEKKPWSRDQLKIILIFVIVVLLWSFRKLIIEWTGISYGDENVAVIAAIIMFILPSSDGKKILVWKDTTKLAWGILILFGGGLALAKMLEVNGVIVQVAAMFEGFSNLSILLLLIVVVSISIFGTEIMSNTALVTVFVPIIAVFCTKAGIPLETLCFPVALAASCAFMLPVGTPPNAIVFSSGQVTIRQMARTGFVLNLLAIFIVVAFAMLFIK
ncbi:MAG: sodium-dependent dicarboxylate transporter 2/3/5 [Flavobacteriaceae bacterium]|jgi:sodium-dependent dicarboxylate transporter 2/3/5